MASLACSSRGFMEVLLNAVGWRFADTGKKAPPFALTFKVPGVEVDVSQVGEGKLVVKNKPDRLEQIKQFLCDVMDRDKITSAEAATLHGQLNFAQGQYNGCVLQPGMACLRPICVMDGSLICKLPWVSWWRSLLLHWWVRRLVSSVFQTSSLLSSSSQMGPMRRVTTCKDQQDWLS